MYLSKKHKLLFIAVPRTASNSVQKMLLDSDITDASDLVHNLGRRGDWAITSSYHARPSMLVDQGVLTATELEEYKAFGFVRDPFERWVSSIFLARFTGVFDKQVDPLSQMCEFIRKDEPRPFAKVIEPHDEKNYGAFSYQNFFFHDGNQVVDAYRFEDVEAVTKKIISETTGEEVTTTFPHVQVNPRSVPDEFKEPIDSWLPADCYKKLKKYFADEIAFYNSVESFSG